MQGFIASAQNLFTTLQLPSTILGAIALLIGFYLFMLGGDDGRRKAKGWFIGAAVGLVGVNGALALANTIQSNIQF